MQAVKAVVLGALGLALASCASHPGKNPLPAVAKQSSATDWPASFETKDYDWGNYATLLVGRIQANWKVPVLAELGWKGRVDVRFTILRDGSIEGLEVLKSSTVPPYDEAAKEAIRQTSPFAPLPEDFPRDRERVTIHFFYNIRPSQVPPAPTPTRRPD